MGQIDEEFKSVHAGGLFVSFTQVNRKTIRQKGESTGYNVNKSHSNGTNKGDIRSDVITLNFTKGHHKGDMKITLMLKN